jgi:hypothetical protein
MGVSSDVRTTLSAVLSSTALRLSALVAAAMSAGYLWRAAVEPGGTAAKVAAAQVGHRLQPADITFDSLDLLRPAPDGEEPAEEGQADTVSQKQATPAAHSSAQLVSVTSSSKTGTAAPAPVRPSPHRPGAKPSKPGRRPKPKPRPTPAPRPNPPPPPAPQPPPPPPPPGPPPVGPPPPPPPPPITAPDTRPGRGRGDKNHRHTGPPGQQKPKKGKGVQGAVGAQGPSNPPAEQGSSGGGHGNGHGNGNGRGKKG